MSKLETVVVDPQTEHRATVIWLHGLGDSGHGFAPIVPALNLPASLGIKFIFPHAPIQPVTVNGGMEMRAWYDIKSMDFNDRADMDGVKISAAQVKQLIDDEIIAGIPSDKIILAGFSQGGVITYYLGLQYPQPLAGLMALSTYLANPASVADERHTANYQTPIFIAHGRFDPVVPEQFGDQAQNTLNGLGYPVQWQTYPMEHAVCQDEVSAISQWLQARLA